MTPAAGLDANAIIGDALDSITSGLESNLPVAVGIGLSVFTLFFLLRKSKKAVNT